MLYDARDCMVWMDMEMTGLDAEKDAILEVACLVTDKDLNVVSGEFHIVINQSDVVVNSMNEWCTKQHTKSGLVEASRSSEVSIKKGEEMLLNFLKKYIPGSTCPLAGNSVSYDRAFLKKFMPSVNEFLHYRIIDVSSIKELLRRWNPKVYEGQPKKKLAHTAMSDIKESIQELKYYKEHAFIPAM